ncbi:MAG: flagellar motor stator protein MotA [Kofleriaceae bacterium]|jgi:chemotaxis protein MotA|nr:flagellar motor stator protein MotA [Kofleriaceae bacterium]MBP9208299.1 flagellar motor stator protein MotA [Kofleriaceae bacterium]
MVPVGIVIVLGAIVGGFAMAGGNFSVLIQPSEFVVIIGAAIGTLVISSPGLMRSRVIHVFKAAMADTCPKKKDYVDILKLMYELFMLARRQGVLALESHATDPAKSDIIKKYPHIAKDDLYRTFLAEALQHMVNGVSPDDLDGLLDAELGTIKTEGHLATGLVTKIGDSLPGIGIVAAVLGIIVVMGHMDAPPAVIGLHVAAALVGTFLGILLCYGILGPIATNVELQEAHHIRFLECIKASVLAVMRGAAPATAVEFGRKMIFRDERPSFSEIDKALQAIKS